jgi:hypothetical protein
MLELRTRVRMRKLLIDQRTAWQQRLQAQLLHQGVAAGRKLRTRAGRGGARRGGALARWARAGGAGAADDRSTAS